MILKTAWKNVWRNRVRSLVVIASVTVGIFAGVFAVAFMNGMIAQRFDAAIDEEISHIQITGKDYLLNNDPEIYMTPEDGIIPAIKSIPGVEYVVTRTIVTGMASTASKSAGVQIIGINPDREKEIFKLYKTIIPGTGDYFETESKYDLALIGQDLAKELNIIRFAIDSTVLSKLRNKEVPDEITTKLEAFSGKRFSNGKKFISTVTSVLTSHELRQYGQLIREEAWSYRENSRMILTFLDRENNQVSSVFRIAGIYDIKNAIFEQSQVFLRNEVLSRLTGIDESSFHKVIIRINDLGESENITNEIRKKFPGLDVKNWKELQPDLAMMTDYVHQIYGFFMVIILAALAFGIINTMLMAVLERTKELGMLTAIGMNKKKVFSMIMLESVFLSITGGITGMIAGWGTILLTAKKGINFAQYAEGMEAIGYSAHIFPEISASFFIMVVILIFLTGIASSVYPALKALKLDPAEAIRTE
ncbi:MAG TPA: FtsX-like permease family protein [Bacteroidales bacterium]|nr:FtsX-like permease family protein [Bacteroidales bacterium]